MGRTISSLVSLLIVLSLGWLVLYPKKDILLGLFQKPCSQPLRYAVGNIDPRFQLDAAGLTDALRQAEEAWEKQSGKNLFEFDSSSEFKINLVFDERQEQAIEAQEMEQTLKKLETTNEETRKKYDALVVVYNKKSKDYAAASKEYAKQLNSFNAKVAAYNKIGGAPEDEYKKLQKEKKELDSDFSALESQRKEINKLVNQLNALAGEDQKNVAVYNANVNTYKNRFGETREFEKGLYSFQDGLQSIDIYQFNEAKDLRLILMHEMGHALGIGHVESDQSLMYYMVGEQDLDNPKLTAEDLVALDTACGAK